MQRPLRKISASVLNNTSQVQAFAGTVLFVPRYSYQLPYYFKPGRGCLLVSILALQSCVA